MAKILIVEDDRELAGVLQDWLVSEHHVVDTVGNGSEADQLLKHYAFDLLVLDWDLPGMPGVQICKNFRSRGGVTPILMLTGKGDIKDKTVGLDAGADDYLTKPFHPDELSARVRALLRRPGQVSATNELRVGDLVLEPTIYRATRKGKELKLLPKEFALLEFLMRHPNVVFSAEALIDRVWSTESDASPDTVRTNIKRLRQKVETEGEKALIVTVHGVGYKLDAQ
jgi:DNA-binding response OmpR family regulator